MFIADPAWLEYDYTRAMLLGGLCHPQPETALFLGLGAGNLTQACLKFLPLEDVEVIELRPAVPELAMQYTGLQNDPRLYIRIGDATELLETAETADLIFVDLYNDSGPDAAHLAGHFSNAAGEKLNPGGWLVINQWGTDDDRPLGLPFAWPVSPALLGMPGEGGQRGGAGAGRFGTAAGFGGRAIACRNVGTSSGLFAGFTDRRAAPSQLRASVRHAGAQRCTGQFTGSLIWCAYVGIPPRTCPRRFDAPATQSAFRCGAPITGLGAYEANMSGLVHRRVCSQPWPDRLLVC